ncbi:MAG TPA: response regulator [Oligoflexia bacterium]|nr:response regulator [Oligoflexia bacterium]
MAKTAMVVDDVAFARQVIKEILTRAKYNVVAEASNGDEAIAMYEKYRPDLVTMDVVMPIRGGIEATRTIIDRNKSARIIMISALAHEQLLMEAINAGARDYILKPFGAEDLLKAADKVLKDDEDEEPKGGAHAKI